LSAECPDQFSIYTALPAARLFHIRTDSSVGRAANLTQAQVHVEVADDLWVNNVRDFNLNSITLQRENASSGLVIDCERRVPLVANNHVTISFDDRID
jgi:hypothetical protein